MGRTAFSSTNHCVILVSILFAGDAARIPSLPDTDTPSRVIIALDRFVAVRVPARMRTVLYAAAIMIDRRSLAILIPGRPFTFLRAVAIIALDQFTAAVAV